MIPDIIYDSHGVLTPSRLIWSPTPSVSFFVLFGGLEEVRLANLVNGRVSLCRALFEVLSLDLVLVARDSGEIVVEEFSLCD